MLSIIIPSYRDPYLQNTIDSLLKNAQTDIEIIPVLDGYTLITPLKKNKRVAPVILPHNQGMRGAVNAGLKKAKGKFIMKCDSHCAFGNGFDAILTKHCGDNQLLIPRRYSLDAANWSKDENRPTRDYHYLTFPVETKGYGLCLSNQDWLQRTLSRNNPKYEIDDTMTMEGSCWLANKKYFMKRVGYLDDSPKRYGPFADEPQEIGLKYWLGGGEIKVVKKTWYAHLVKRPHHYSNGVFERKYKINFEAVQGHTWSAKHWMGNEEPDMLHPISWLIEKFWPVPTWPEDRNLWCIKPKTQTILNISPKPTGSHVTSLNPTEETPLCKLAIKYGTDKCAKFKHPYTPYYYKLFNKKRNEIKKLLELGIGFPETMRHVRNYHRGASLYLWRDFFPKAQIFGADIRKDILFNEGRIKTFFCDETKKVDLHTLIKNTGPNIDIFIDDALHDEDSQVFVCQTLMPFLKKNVTYIIEDVENYEKVISLLAKKFSCKAILFPPSKKSRMYRNLVIVKHKKNYKLNAKT